MADKEKAVPVIIWVFAAIIVGLAMALMLGGLTSSSPEHPASPQPIPKSPQASAGVATASAPVVTTVDSSSTSQSAAVNLPDITETAQTDRDDIAGLSSCLYDNYKKMKKSIAIANKYTVKIGRAMESGDILSAQRAVDEFKVDSDGANYKNAPDSPACDHMFTNEAAANDMEDATEEMKNVEAYYADMAKTLEESAEKGDPIQSKADVAEDMRQARISQMNAVESADTAYRDLGYSAKQVTDDFKLKPGAKQDTSVKVNDPPSAIKYRKVP